eukprot:1499356-Pyramimonas_sp.AAC.1
MVRDMERSPAKDTDTQLRPPSLRRLPPRIKWLPTTTVQKQHQKYWIWGSLAKPDLASRQSSRHS